MTSIGRIWFILAYCHSYWQRMQPIKSVLPFCSALPIQYTRSYDSWQWQHDSTRVSCWARTVQQSIDMSWQSQTLLRILCEQCQQADWGAVWRADSGGSRWWRNLANMMDRHVFRRRCGCRYHYCSNLSAIFWLILFSFYSSVLAVSVMLCHWNSLHRATRLMSTFTPPYSSSYRKRLLTGQLTTADGAVRCLTRHSSLLQSCLM